MKPSTDTLVGLLMGDTLPPGKRAQLVRLANAAPDLVGALDSAEGFIDEVHREATSSRFTDRAGWGDTSGELLLAIRAALAKAE